MRLTFLFIFVGLMQVTASLYSQTTKLNLDFRNSRVVDVLDAIESQSEFRFAYSAQYIDVNRKVNVDVKDKSIEQTLSVLFEGAGVNYSINDRHIMLYRADMETNSSQQPGKSITGKVTDSSGATLPGVSVVVKGTTNGSITDSNGMYTISNIPKNATLVFTFIGMKLQEKPIDGASSLNVILQEEMIGLDEVVVIGYGTKQKKNLTGAVDQISAAIIENRPVSNTMQALQGASANLIIQQKSMNPNDNSMNINIRGISTMNNNDPLIVIDGIITESGSLNNLNPSDIENISVLKDAGSAAIYGSRSSNGVILVSTKKGSKNKKPTLRFNSMVGVQDPEVLYSPVKGYENALLKNQALINGGSSPIYTPAQIRDFQENGEGQWFLDGILQNALQQNYNVSLSGGNETSTYMISAGIYDQGSNFVGNYGAKRYNFRTNLVNDYGRLKVSALMAYNRSLQTSPNSSAGTLIVDGGRIPNYYNYKMKSENGHYLLNDVLSEFNPLGILEAGGSQKKDDDNFLGSLNAEFKIMKGLTAKGIMGLDLSANHRYIRVLQVPFYPSETSTSPKYANSNRNTEDYNEKKYILNTQAFLDFDRTFNKDHHVTGLLGASNESYTRQANEIKKKFTDIDLGLPETLTEIDKSSYNTPAQTQERSINSVFGRAGYSFRDKYYGEFSFRYDGSSKFAEDYRWGFFPSMSAGWRISEENFMASYKEKVGDLKFRGSYGILGNQNVDDYSYFTTYNVYTNSYGFNNQAVSGTGFSFGNSELQWEQSANFNIGVDATFFQSKFLVSLDYFNKVTSQILLTPEIPMVFGGAVAKENAGEMTNQGWEATLSYRARTGAFKHNLTLNIADTKNEVTDFGGEERIDGSDQMMKIIREGEAFGSYFGFKTDGLFQSYEEIANSVLPIGVTVQPGDVRYVDTNDDKVIDDKDRQVLGNAFPRYTFGFNYNLEWKGFDLGLMIQGVGKRDMFLRGELVEPFHSNYSYVMYTHQLDYWTPTNTDARWPRLAATGSTSNTNNYQRNGSDIYIFNAAYLRLKNIQLGYTLPNQLTSKIGVQKCRLSVNAQNLFTLSNVSFIDPESSEFGNNMGGVGGVGANSGRNYPTLKYYGFGLDLEF
ncbi:MAG TPA: TonB-dependent receptor [Prolixibacteraceae bacterium]